MTIGSSASSRRINDAGKCPPIIASPEARPGLAPWVPCHGVYWEVGKPSAFWQSFGTHFGPAPVLGIWGILIRVVSSGGSAAIASDRSPMKAALPARLTPFRNSRRLQFFSLWLFMCAPHLACSDEHDPQAIL